MRKAYIYQVDNFASRFTDQFYIADRETNSPYYLHVSGWKYGQDLISLDGYFKTLDEAIEVCQKHNCVPVVLSNELNKQAFLKQLNVLEESLKELRNLVSS